jgi:hypothetical protein
LHFVKKGTVSKHGKSAQILFVMEQPQIKGINTAGQALHQKQIRDLRPPDGFRGKPRGIKPFGSSLARSCPCKHGRDLVPFVNKRQTNAHLYLGIVPKLTEFWNRLFVFRSG